VKFIPFWESLHTHALLELSFLFKNVFLEENFCAYWILTLNYILVCFLNANWTRISVLYTCVFWKLFRKYFSAIFLSFSVFLCEVSGRWFDCLDGKIDSSEHPFSLSGWACFYDLLSGTTSGRHLSSVRTVNPVGLYQIPPAPQPSHFAFLVLFVALCFFFVLFMLISHVHVSSLQFISNPGMFL